MSETFDDDGRGAFDATPAGFAPQGGAARRLLLSIHDVAPRFLGEVERLTEWLGADGDTGRVALLVVPAHWGSDPVRPGTPFATWLRARHAAGAEIFVHGWTHRGEAPTGDAWTRFKASRLTAGEGEFLTLGEDEALRRMIRGRQLLQDIVGGEVDGFIAPAWLYGPGAMTALTSAGFRIAESHMRVWNPQSGDTVARGPVITWASRTPARLLSSLTFAALARSALRKSPVVRIGVHPADIGEPSLAASIGATTRHFRRTHEVARYRDLLAPDTLERRVDAPALSFAN